MLRYYTTDIVNVRMIITEEKIISNIDKILKSINPNNKKQIVSLAQDRNFKELIESIKTYIEEYPNKKAFPTDVYVEAFKLVQFATAQFDIATKKVESLIRKREENLILAGIIKEIVNLAAIKNPEFKERIKQSLITVPGEVLQYIYIVYRSKDNTSPDYTNAIVNLKAQVSNLESNAHIQVDLERLEDRIKALTLIGVGLATELKTIPLTQDKVIAVKKAFMEMKAKQLNNQAKQNCNIQNISGNQILKGQVPKVNYEENEQVQKQIPKQVNQVQQVPQASQVPNYMYQNQMQYYPKQTQQIPNYQNMQQRQVVNMQMQKPKQTFWQKVKNSKIIRAIKLLFNIRVVVEIPKALPEGRS